MDEPIFEVGRGGARFTVFVAMDIETGLYLALAIFLALVLAGFVYKRM